MYTTLYTILYQKILYDYAIRIDSKVELATLISSKVEVAIPISSKEGGDGHPHFFQRGWRWPFPSLLRWVEVAIPISSKVEGAIPSHLF